MKNGSSHMNETTGSFIMEVASVASDPLVAPHESRCQGVAYRARLCRNLACGHFLDEVMLNTIPRSTAGSQHYLSFPISFEICLFIKNGPHMKNLRNSWV